MFLYLKADQVNMRVNSLSRSAIRIRLLALHGFGGTFGSKAGLDVVQDLRAGLAERGVVVEIVAPKAPNQTPYGEAWLAGDQIQLGQMVGFVQTDLVVAVEGLQTECTRPLAEADLPLRAPWHATSHSDNVWHASKGFAASLAFLERLWGEAAAEGRPFDGVLGFSQGAFTAGLLCAHLQNNRPELVPPRFVVCCCGLMRPWPPQAQAWWPPAVGALTTPSLHATGQEDTVVARVRSEELARLFSGAERFEHHLRGHPAAYRGHVVPWRSHQEGAAFFDKLAALAYRTCANIECVAALPSC